MALIPIVFVAMSLAFPIWIYSNSKREAAHIPWTKIEATLTQFVDDGGGFPPCSTSRVTEILRELCNSSSEAYHEPASIDAERSARGVVFGCQFKKDALTVRWTAQEDSGAELNCGYPGARILTRAPGFVYGFDGQLQRFEFDNTLGVRESFPVDNCREKAARAKALSPEPKLSLEDFLQKLGTKEGDPQDISGANKMCLAYGSNESWKPWRDLYLR